MDAATPAPAGRLRALNLIGASWQEANGAQHGDSVNPATGREIGSFAAGTGVDARLAVAAARSAFSAGAWPRDRQLRSALLMRWADCLSRRADLARLLTLENGKVLAQSQAEMSAAIACLRRHAQALESAPDSAAAGVVAILAPWHAPVAALMESLAPALAAGCTAVLKPPRQCVHILAALVGELAGLDGVPAGVVNLVAEAGQEVTRELVASPDVDVLCFTGAVESGRRMAQASAHTAKRLLLDLSGKSCALVFDGVDVDEMARQLAAAALVAAGQHGSAPRRILLQEGCFDAAIAALSRALGRVVVGAGERAGCGLGPLIDASALLAAGVRIERSLARCDQVLLRGRRGAGELAEGFFLSPTLVIERKPSATATIDEIFGPFVSLGRFDDEEQALAAAGQMPLAHTVSVWTGDADKGRRLARRLRHGRVLLDCHDWLAPPGRLILSSFKAASPGQDQP